MKLKDIKQKLNPQIAIIGGAIVLTTSLGTCHFVYEDAAEPVVEEEPAEKPEEHLEKQPKIEEPETPTAKTE